jgi:hypothetical protein
MDKKQLIRMLKEVFEAWESELAKLNEEQLTTPGYVEKDRSIKDILAHLTGWQQVSVARLQAALEDKEPDYPRWSPELDVVHETNNDAVNAWIYGAYSARSWAEVHGEWRDRFHYVLQLAEAIPEEDWFVVGKPAWLGEYKLSAVLEGSHEHHQEHLDDLKARRSD